MLRADEPRWPARRWATDRPTTAGRRPGVADRQRVASLAHVASRRRRAYSATPTTTRKTPQRAAGRVSLSPAATPLSPRRARRALRTPGALQSPPQAVARTQAEHALMVMVTACRHHRPSCRRRSRRRCKAPPSARRTRQRARGPPRSMTAAMLRCVRDAAADALRTGGARSPSRRLG